MVSTYRLVFSVLNPQRNMQFSPIYQVVGSAQNLTKFMQNSVENTEAEQFNLK